MTDDELILRALSVIHRIEARREPTDVFRALKVDSLLRRRVKGSTVHFESNTSQANIKITVNRDRGEILEASFFLPPPSDFVAYIGPEYIHDSTIVSIERTNAVVTVRLQALDGREFSVEFVGVDSISAEHPENMFLYALTEMRHPLPLRRFVFFNSDEDSTASLVIVAENVTVRPPSVAT